MDKGRMVSHSCQGIGKPYSPIGSRWKLHLRPKHLASSINKNDDLPPLPPRKRAVDVLTDFIKYLFKCTKTYIQERHMAFTWSSHEDSIEYIFTHPNGWEGVQQQLYRQAIEAAGLVPATSQGRARVQLLTEGEASLHFCVADLINTEQTDHAGPQGIVIIDAGGGTIDLSMFSMETDPITCDEIAAAECKQLHRQADLSSHSLSGRLQGSVFVTRRARLLLEGWSLTSSAPSVTNVETRKAHGLGACHPRRHSRVYARVRPDNETCHQER